MEEKNKDEATKEDIKVALMLIPAVIIVFIIIANENSIKYFFNNLSFDGLFTLLVHLLIIVGLVAMVIFMARNIVNENDKTEQFIKILAVVLGLFVYFAAKGLNLSISDLVVESMQTTKPIVIGVVGFISPTILGIFSAWYIKRIFNSKNVIAERVILIFATLMITLFGEVYISSYSVSGNTKLLPNVMFVAGVILYIVLGYTGKDKT